MTCSRRRGFTVKELLAAIVIIGLLAGLAVMGLQKPDRSGRRTICLSSIRQAAQAGIAYSSRHQYLPTSRSWATEALGPNGTLPADLPGDPETLAYSWVQPLLSDLDCPNLAAEINELSASKQPSFGAAVPVLICPSDAHHGERAAALDYAINAGRANCDGKWLNHDWKANGGSHDALRRFQDYADYRRNRMTPADLVDGASLTIAFAENVYLRTWCLYRMAQPPVTAITEFHSGIIWDPNVRSFPRMPAFDESIQQRGGVNLGSVYAHPSSRHMGGFNVAFWDGSARFVNNKIDYTVYARLMSSDGHNTQDPCTNDFAGPTPVWQAHSLRDVEW